MQEPELQDIFKSANGVDVVPAGGIPAAQSNNDGDQIPSKSAEELEREVAAAAAASSDNGDGQVAGANDKGDEGDDGAGDQGNEDYDVEIMSTLLQAISEKSGIATDIESIKSPEDLIGAIDSIINAKSTPKYANEISEEFDKFIRDGGDPFEFMSEMMSSVSNPQLETQEDKENLIRNVLKEAGFSDRQIDKKIDLYIENDTLDEEANDALDIIKRKNAKASEENIKLNKQRELEAINEQKKFFKSIEDHIDKLTNIGDIPVTKDQATKLRDYLLKFDRNDGLTGYQRDMDASIANLIESAFYIQNKATILKAAQSKGSSDAISKLKSVLNSKNKVSGTQGGNRGRDNDSLTPWLKQAAALSGRAA